MNILDIKSKHSPYLLGHESEADLFDHANEAGIQLEVGIPWSSSEIHRRLNVANHIHLPGRVLDGLDHFDLLRRLQLIQDLCHDGIRQVGLGGNCARPDSLYHKE